MVSDGVMGKLPVTNDVSEHLCIIEENISPDVRKDDSSFRYCVSVYNIILRRSMWQAYEVK